MHRVEADKSFMKSSTLDVWQDSEYTFQTDQGIVYKFRF